MVNVSIVTKDPAFRTALTEQIAGLPQFNMVGQGVHLAFPALILIDGHDLGQHDLVGDVPHIALCHDGTESDKARALGFEVMTKPVRLALLLMRMQSVVKQMEQAGKAAIFGSFVFEPAKRQITSKDTHESIRLTEKETAILTTLAAAEGKAVSKPALLADVWGYDPSIDTHTLETHIYQLRKKLGDEGPMLLANENGGYVLRSAGL